MTAERIAQRLAGGEKIKPTGGGNYLVPCPAHDDANPSLSLRDGDHGNLVVHCFVGCAPADIYAAIRRLDSALLKPGDTAPEPAKGSREYERRQHDKAGWLWNQRRPIAGSLAETYLREARGYVGALPLTLGFLPPLKREHEPALIAAFGLVDEPEPGVLGKPRNMNSVHLTLLKRDGSGKADVKPNKLIIGSPTIKVGDEMRGLPIVLAPPNDLMGLGITEGLEDGLSVHAATGLGAWAAGAAGFMPKLAAIVPSYIESVTIFAHPDVAGERGARELAKALRQRNIEVAVEGL
jgi:hypothetical protein